MPMFTIDVPKKILECGSGHHLLLVDPVEYERELRLRWENEDARYARNVAQREFKSGETRGINDLKELM